MNRQDLKGSYTGCANRGKIRLQITDTSPNALKATLVKGEFRDESLGTDPTPIMGGVWDDSENKLIFMRNDEDKSTFQTYVGYLIAAEDRPAIAGYFTDSHTGKLYGWYLNKDDR